MPEKEPKIYQEQPQKPGKLTPEEVKEMVKKFKEEHEGLLPEYFSLPGEEKEEEREYPEEYFLYLEREKEFQRIKEEMKNEMLWKNAIYQMVNVSLYNNLDYYDICATEGPIGPIANYIYLTQSGLWEEIKNKFPKECEKIEKTIESKDFLSVVLDSILNIYSIYEEEKSEKWNDLEYRARHLRSRAKDIFFPYASLVHAGLWEKIKKDQEFEKKAKKIEEILENKEFLESLLYLEPGENYSIELCELLIHSSFLTKIKNQFPKEYEEIEKITIKRWKTFVGWAYTEAGVGRRNVKPPGDWDALHAFCFYHLTSLSLEQLRKLAERKMKLKESQKAMHPEKKKLPPIPEEKAF
jgi:hypothetical protein